MKKSNSQPFEGLKVLDFSRVIAGPLATEYFAQLGASVIRIESSMSPDTLRMSAPYQDFQMGINRSGYFAAYNANKYSLGLNWKHPKAKFVIKRLVERCDIIVENFSPGVMWNFGLDYEHLKEVKPDVIMLSTSNQGQTGPKAKTPGYGFTLCALTGLTNMTGWADRGPCHPFGALTDFMAPILGAISLVGALEYRRRTGKGQFIDLSQYEASLYFLSPVILDHSVNGRNAGRLGNRSPFSVPHGAYPCKEENSWCVISIGKDTDEWTTFCEMMGKPSFAGHPNFGSFGKRKENEDKLDAIVSRWTKQKSAKEVMDLLQRVGIAAAAVKNIADLFIDPQLRHRGHYHVLEHPEIIMQSYEMPPYRLSVTPPKLEKQAPCLGENTEKICRELLEIPEEEFVDLLINEVFS